MTQCSKHWAHLDRAFCTESQPLIDEDLTQVNSKFLKLPATFMMLGWAQSCPADGIFLIYHPGLEWKGFFFICVVFVHVCMYVVCMMLTVGITVGHHVS